MEQRLAVRYQERLQQQQAIRLWQVMQDQQPVQLQKRLFRIQRGEKELNWDNVKQSAVTVAKDTAIDGTIGIVTDRAIPKLKTQTGTKHNRKRLVKNIIYDSPREIYVNTSTNVVTNGIKNISGGNKNSSSGNVGAGAAAGMLAGLQLGGFKHSFDSLFLNRN